MSKVRINDLARELEVKSKAILDVLLKVGVTEKKTHSSSIEADEADRVRKYLGGQSGAASQKESGPRGAESEIKTKIDLSHISKPGDVANLLRRKQEAAAAPPPKPPVAVPAAAVPKPTAAPPIEKVAAAPPVAPPEAPARRVIKPSTAARPSFAVPPPALVPETHAPVAKSAATQDAAPVAANAVPPPTPAPVQRQQAPAAVQVTPPSAQPAASIECIATAARANADCSGTAPDHSPDWTTAGLHCASSAGSSSSADGRARIRAARTASKRRHARTWTAHFPASARYGPAAARATPRDAFRSETADASDAPDARWPSHGNGCARTGATSASGHSSCW